MYPRQPLGDEMQRRLAIAELLQRADRCDDVVAIGAGLAVTLAHVMQLLLEREPSGILRVPAVDHVAQRPYPPLALALEPDRAHAFAIDRGHLLARAQIGDGLAAVGRGHAIGDAATGSAAVEAEHETRPLRRPAVDEGINAERPMRANEPRLDPLRNRNGRPTDQLATGKAPEVFGRVREIRIHGVWYQRTRCRAQVAHSLMAAAWGRT